MQFLEIQFFLVWKHIMMFSFQFDFRLYFSIVLCDENNIRIFSFFRQTVGDEMNFFLFFSLSKINICY